MTLLGAGAGFQLGTTTGGQAAPVGVNASLDDIIKNRQKEAKKKQPAIKRDASNADRSIATSRAKRNAAVRARRGLQDSSKPTRMQIETEVKKQSNKTAINNLNKQNQNKSPRNKLTGKERAEKRKEERDVRKAGKKAAKEEKVTIKPTKKQVKAARDAMIQAGYPFPANHKLEVVPVQKNNPKKNTSTNANNPNKGTNKQNKPQQKQKKPNNNNNKMNTST